MTDLAKESISIIVTIVKMCKDANATKQTLKAVGRKIETLLPLLTRLSGRDEETLVSNILSEIKSDVSEIRSLIERVEKMNRAVYFVRAKGFHDDVEKYLGHTHFSLMALETARNDAVQLELKKFRRDWNTRQDEMDAIREEEHNERQGVLTSSNSPSLLALGVENEQDRMDALRAMKDERDRFKEELKQNRDSAATSKAEMEQQVMDMVIEALSSSLVPSPPSSGLPDWALCPILTEVMYDPVSVDGTCMHTCSRQAARTWLDDERKTVCPICSAPLRSKHLAPNAELRRAIEDQFPNMATSTAATLFASTAPKTTESNDVVQPHEPANNATTEISDDNCSSSAAALDSNVPPSSCYLRYKWRIVCVTSLLIMAGAVVAVLFSVAPTPPATELISNSSAVPTSPPTPITPTPSNSAGPTAAATEPPSNSAVPTTSSPTLPPTPIIPAQIFDVLTQVSSADDLNDPSSPQYQAARWAMDDKSKNPLSNNSTLVQRYVLSVFYYSTNGNSWVVQYDFLNHNKSECQWNDFYGIGCTDGSVSKISLDNNTLAGRIPSELGSLSNLQALYLYNNSLMGTIPSSLGSLLNLEVLSLTINGLTGTVPFSLGSLSNLKELYLHRNSLTGIIPSSLGSLSNLKELYLYENSLTGTIPSSLGSLTNLKQLWLFHNSLTGSIPSSLGSLSNLETLALYDNSLSASIPSSLGSLSNLKELWLFHNSLTGSIPSSLGSLSNLDYLYLHENRLTGTIPSSLGSLSNLKHLYLNLNSLTGTIPSSLGSLSNLKQLTLSDNELTGDAEFLCSLPNRNRFWVDKGKVDCSCCVKSN